MISLKYTLTDIQAFMMARTRQTNPIRCLLAAAETIAKYHLGDNNPINQQRLAEEFVGHSNPTYGEEGMAFQYGGRHEGISWKTLKTYAIDPIIHETNSPIRYQISNPKTDSGLIRSIKKRLKSDTPVGVAPPARAGAHAWIIYECNSRCRELFIHYYDPGEDRNKQISRNAFSLLLPNGRDIIFAHSIK